MSLKYLHMPDMGEDKGVLLRSYKTWLCNAAIFALICAAFAAGIIVGPMVSSRGKDDVKDEIRCGPDEAARTKQNSKSKCVSLKDLTTFMSDWSQSLDDLIEAKMLNVSRGKINPSIKKLLRAKDAATKKALQGIITFLVCTKKSNAYFQVF